VSSAVLHMRQDGVNHVLFLENGGLPVLFFMNEAQSQGWHPRYGLNSQDGPEVLVSGGDVPSAQMDGAEGIGWLPSADLPYGGSTANPYLAAPGVQRCLGIMSRAGQAPTSADSLAIALGTCDQLWFLVAAVDAGGQPINASSFVAGVDRLGDSFASVVTIGTELSADQHDGAAEARYYSYGQACGCWSYTGPIVDTG
jgi:hypothetical protein